MMPTGKASGNAVLAKARALGAECGESVTAVLLGEGVAQLSKQMLRLHGKAGLLLHITAKYVPHTLFLSLM